MARVNVYIPDALAAQARASGMNVSALTQDAIRRALATSATDQWLARLAGTPTVTAVDHDTALGALDAVRDEPTTRHG